MEALYLDNEGRLNTIPMTTVGQFKGFNIGEEHVLLALYNEAGELVTDLGQLKFTPVERFLFGHSTADILGLALRAEKSQPHFRPYKLNRFIPFTVAPFEGEPLITLVTVDFTTSPDYNGNHQLAYYQTQIGMQSLTDFGNSNPVTFEVTNPEQLYLRLTENGIHSYFFVPDRPENLVNGAVYEIEKALFDANVPQ